jgi:Protein of unknown function (DUF1559)
MTRERKHPGFSLPEILLVTALLFVLAAIMLVVLEPARRIARAATCTSNLRQIGMAYKMYVADYGQYPDPGEFTRSPYLNNPRILFCPEDTTFVAMGASTSYRFRSEVPPRFIPLSQVHDLDPNVVLAGCQHHTGLGSILLRNDKSGLPRSGYPYHLVLRADGSVERIHVSRIKQFFQSGNRPTLVTIYPGEPGYEEAGS